MLNIRKFLSDIHYKYTCKPLAHIICSKNENGYIPLLQLTYKRGRAPHNYPKAGEIVVLKTGIYEVELVLHNFNTREVIYQVRLYEQC